MKEEKYQGKENRGYHCKKEYTEVEKKEVTAINLFIIREIFKCINNKVSLKEFYSFLYEPERKISLVDMFSVCEKFDVSLEDFYSDLRMEENMVPIDKSQQKKYEYRVEAYLRRNEGNIKQVINTLISYGVSSEFFDGKKIRVSEKVWKSCKLYIYEDYKKDPNKIYSEKERQKEQNENYDFTASARDRKKIQQELMKEIYTICNLDGSLIIESIRDIIMDMTHTNISENHNSTDVTLLQQIDNYQVPQGASYGQNDLVKLYSQMAKQVNEKEFTFDIKTSDFSRIKKTTDNEIVCDNLFIILKTYQMFAKIEGIQDADEKLKTYLSLEDDDYTDLINGKTVCINSKDIAEKLSIYRFPATLFKSDRPTMINISKNIWDAFCDFKIDYDIILFEFRLQFWLTYCIDIKNIVLILAVYSLFNSLNDK